MSTTPTGNNKRKTKDEKRTTKNERRTMKNEKRKTKNEGRTTKDERRKTSDEKRATKNETWILNSTLLQKLESFQAELAKRILRLPTCTSNNNTLMALQWPSMRARILIIKLCFLFKVVNSDLTLSARVFRSLAASDVASLVITCQCRFLDSIYKANYTTAVLTSSDGISNHSLQKEILQL